MTRVLTAGLTLLEATFSANLGTQHELDNLSPNIVRRQLHTPGRGDRRGTLTLAMKGNRLPRETIGTRNDPHSWLGESLLTVAVFGHKRAQPGVDMYLSIRYIIRESQRHRLVDNCCSVLSG